MLNAYEHIGIIQGGGMKSFLQALINDEPADESVKLEELQKLFPASAPEYHLLTDFIKVNYQTKTKALVLLEKFLQKNPAALNIRILNALFIFLAGISNKEIKIKENWHLLQQLSENELCSNLTKTDKPSLLKTSLETFFSLVNDDAKFIDFLSALLEFNQFPYDFNPILYHSLTIFCYALYKNKDAPIHQWISNDRRLLLAEAFFAYPQCLLSLSELSAAQSYTPNYVTWVVRYVTTDTLPQRIIRIFNLCKIPTEHLQFYVLRLFAYFQNEPDKISSVFLQLEYSKESYDNTGKKNYENMLSHYNDLVSKNKNVKLVSQSAELFTKLIGCLASHPQQMAHYLSKIPADKFNLLTFTPLIKALLVSNDQARLQNWQNARAWLKDNPESAQFSFELLYTVQNTELDPLIAYQIRTLLLEQEKPIEPLGQEKSTELCHEKVCLSFVRLYSAQELAQKSAEIAQWFAHNKIAVSFEALLNVLPKNYAYLIEVYRLSCFAPHQLRLFYQFAAKETCDEHIVALSSIINDPNKDQEDRKKFVLDALVNIRASDISYPALSTITSMAIESIKLQVETLPQNSLIYRVISYFTNVTPSDEIQQVFVNFISQIGWHEDELAAFFKNNAFAILLMNWLSKKMSTRGPLTKFLFEKAAYLVELNTDIFEKEPWQNFCKKILTEPTLVNYKNETVLHSFFSFLNKSDQENVAHALLSGSERTLLELEARCFLIKKTPINLLCALFKEHPQQEFLAAGILIHEQLSIVDPDTITQICAHVYQHPQAFFAILSSRSPGERKFQAVTTFLKYLAEEKNKSLLDWLGNDSVAPINPPLITLLNYCKVEHSNQLAILFKQPQYHRIIQNYLLQTEWQEQPESSGLLYALLAKAWAHSQEDWQFSLSSFKLLNRHDRAIALQQWGQWLRNIYLVTHFNNLAKNPESLLEKIISFRWLNQLEKFQQTTGKQQLTNIRHLQQLEQNACEKNLLLSESFLRRFLPETIAQLFLHTQVDKVESDPRLWQGLIDNVNSFAKWPAVLSWNSGQYLDTFYDVLIKSLGENNDNAFLLTEALQQLLYYPLIDKLQKPILDRFAAKIPFPNLKEKLHQLYKFYNNYGRKFTLFDELQKSKSLHEAINYIIQLPTQDFTTLGQIINHCQTPLLLHIYHFSSTVRASKSINLKTILLPSPPNHDFALHLVKTEIEALRKIPDAHTKITIASFKYYPHNNSNNELRFTTLDEFLGYWQASDIMAFVEIIESHQSLFLSKDQITIDKFLTSLQALSDKSGFAVLLADCSVALMENVLTSAVQQAHKYRSLILRLSADKRLESEKIISSQLQKILQEHFPQDKCTNLASLSPQNSSRLHKKDVTTILTLEHLLYLIKPKEELAGWLQQSPDSERKERSRFCADASLFAQIYQLSQQDKEHQPLALYQNYLRDHALCKADFVAANAVTGELFQPALPGLINFYLLLLHCFHNKDNEPLLINLFAWLKTLNTNDIEETVHLELLLQHIIRLKQFIPLLQYFERMPPGNIVQSNWFFTHVIQCYQQFLKNKPAIEMEKLESLLPLHLSWSNLVIILRLTSLKLDRTELLASIVKNQAHCHAILADEHSKKEFFALIETLSLKVEDLVTLYHSAFSREVRSFILTHLLLRQLPLQPEQERGTIGVFRSLQGLVNNISLDAFQAPIITELFTAQAAVQFLCSVKNFHHLDYNRFTVLFNKVDSQLRSGLLAYWLTNYLDFPNAGKPLLAILAQFETQTILFRLANRTTIIEKAIIAAYKYGLGRDAAHLLQDMGQLVPFAEECHLVLAVNWYLETQNPFLAQFITNVLQQLREKNTQFNSDSIITLLKIKELANFANARNDIQQILHRHVENMSLTANMNLFFNDKDEVLSELMVTYLSAEDASSGASIKIIDYFLVHSPIINDRLKLCINTYLAYCEKLPTAQCQQYILETAGLLKRNTANLEVKKMLVQQFLQFPHLLSPEISVLILRYDSAYVIDHFGKKKDYQRIIQLFNDCKDLLNNPNLQQAAAEAAFEQEQQNLMLKPAGFISRAWRNLVTHWQRLMFYGFDGFFAIRTPKYVEPYYAQVNSLNIDTTTTVLETSEIQSLATLLNREPDPDDLDALSAALEIFNKRKITPDECSLRQAADRYVQTCLRQRGSNLRGFAQYKPVFMDNRKRLAEIYLQNHQEKELVQLFSCGDLMDTTLSTFKEQLLKPYEPLSPPIPVSMSAPERETTSALTTGINYLLWNPIGVLSNAAASVANTVMGSLSS